MTALSYKSTLPDEMIDIIFIKYLIRIGATSEELERAGLSPEIKEKGCFGTYKRKTDNYCYSTEYPPPLSGGNGIANADIPRDGIANPVEQPAAFIDGHYRLKLNGFIKEL